MPAMMNETMTAGPDLGTASESTKKMPVPTVAPTPNMVSWNVPIDLFRPCPGWSPDVDMFTGLRRNNGVERPFPTVVISNSARVRPLPTALPTGVPR